MTIKNNMKTTAFILTMLLSAATTAQQTPTTQERSGVQNG
jgi:hypothetical protein